VGDAHGYHRVGSVSSHGALRRYTARSDHVYSEALGVRLGHRRVRCM
jgi:hypothetical protein